MVQRSVSSPILAWVTPLLDQWEEFLAAERALYELPEVAEKESPLFVRMEKAEMAVDHILQLAIDQDGLVDLVESYREAVADRGWTLPALLRLNLRVAELILEWPSLAPAANGPNPVVNWELHVIPAVGRREDLHRFVSAEASQGLMDQGIVPGNGTTVILGATTPDDLLAWMSDPTEVIAWRHRCMHAPNQVPVAEGLPLLELEEGKANEAHLGGFLYVVGMVARGTMEDLPKGSPLKVGDFETVEKAWTNLSPKWEGRLSNSLSITEPDEVWEGSVFSIGSTLLQSFYLQHAVGGAEFPDGEGPVFAVVVDSENERFQVVGLFPDGELIKTELEEDMVAFLPALLESPEFEFDMVEASALNDWVREVRGEDMPALKPHRLS